jgi:hypothetical protein
MLANPKSQVRARQTSRCFGYVVVPSFLYQKSQVLVRQAIAFPRNGRSDHLLAVQWVRASCRSKCVGAADGCSPRVSYYVLPGDVTLRHYDTARPGYLCCTAVSGETSAGKDISFRARRAPVKKKRPVLKMCLLELAKDHARALDGDSHRRTSACLLRLCCSGKPWSSSCPTLVMVLGVLHLWPFTASIRDGCRDGGDMAPSLLDPMHS